MNDYTYKISIQAKTQDEAIKKMNAISILLDELQEKELSKLAHVVKNDPIKTKMAKIALGV
jgi:hypothetical protein